MARRMVRLLSAVAAFSLAAASAAAASDESEAAHADDQREEVVALPPEVREEFGIELAVAGAGWIERWISLPGEVRPNEDRLAHIVPRFAGIATEVRAQVGDSVEAGETLAVVESSQSLALYPLRTLTDGIVIEKHITRGEAVTEDRTCFVVADLRDVWVDVSVYQNHLPEIAVGQEVAISAGHGQSEAHGRIAYVAPVLDESTRTAVGRVVLPNPDGALRPGLFVTARVIVERTEVPIALAAAALQLVEGRESVFVETEGDFVPRPVEVGRRAPDRVEIRAGLAAGERYVVQGGFVLKSELAREALSGGHGH